MKTLLTILTAITIFSCTHKETPTEAYIRKNKEAINNNNVKLDSINNELLKLGVKDEPGR